MHHYYYTDTARFSAECGTLRYLQGGRSHEVVTVKRVSDLSSSKLGCQIYLLPKSIIIVSSSVCYRRPTADTCERRLCLGSLGLLAPLFGGLLLLQLLIAKSSQGTRNLLDLVACEVFGQLLRELLQEESVVGFLGVATNNWDQGITQVLELGLGLGVENRQLGEVDGVVGILGINHNSAGSGSLTTVADSNLAKEILRVAKVGLLLSATETLSLLRFSLFLTRLVIFEGGAGSVGLTFCDSLCF